MFGCRACFGLQVASCEFDVASLTFHAASAVAVRIPPELSPNEIKAARTMKPCVQPPAPVGDPKQLRGLGFQGF